MATQPISAQRVARSKRISVRTIGDEDLRFALKQGLEDFRDLRGDLVYPLRFLSQKHRSARLFPRGAMDLADVIAHA